MKLFILKMYVQTIISPRLSKRSFVSFPNPEGMVPLNRLPPSQIMYKNIQC